MGNLTWMMMIITIASLPLLVIYRTGDSIDPIIDVPSTFGNWTIANLGFDSIHCALISLGLRDKLIYCPYGSIQELEPNNFGINFYDQMHRNTCQVNETLYHNTKCSGVINGEKFKKYYQSNCLLKTKCNVNVFDFFLPEESYFPGNTTKQKEYKECTAKTNNFFVQFECKQTKE
jgi:hypothetical protein